MIRFILAPNASPMTLDGTRTYLVGAERPVVIDPGPADPAHLDAVVAALAGARPSAILLTHGHPDHAAGAAPLAERTGAPVWMAGGALGPAVRPERVDHWIRGGDRVETDGGALVAVPTPGHAPEHTAFLWRPGPPASGPAALFVGDLFMGEGDTTLVAPPEGDLADYLRSLDEVERLSPATLYPTHGPPIEDAAEAVGRYRAHRLDRISQVEAALRDRPGATAGELVERVYGADLHPLLRAAAEGSLRAIVAYLRRED